MTKLTTAVLAVLSCALLLSGVLVALFAVMDAIRLEAENGWRAVFALPLLAAGARLYILLDRECDKRAEKQAPPEP